MHDSEPTAFDHRRAAHPDVRILGRDDHVADAEHRRVAREAVPGIDPHQRHQPAQPGEEEEGPTVEEADTRGIGVAGPPTSTLGEEDHGKTHRLGQREQTILLAVVLQALRTGQHRVVVRHGDDLSGVPLEQIAVDRADPADHPVGRSALDQLVDRTPPALSRDHQRAVLDERAFVDEVGDVLACGAPTDRPASFDRLGTSCIETHRVTGVHLLEVGSNRPRDRRPPIVTLPRGRLLPV